MGCASMVEKAVLLSFRLNDNKPISHAAGGQTSWFDKVPSRFDGMSDTDFRAAGFRAVPGSFVRRGSFIGKNVVLMPSFVNIGAYVDEGTMVDTWATVGSCAQIGQNCLFLVVQVLVAFLSHYKQISYY